MANIFFSEVFDYTNDSWLKPYRDKFIAVWTNRTLNFHQTTTNRAEGMHALLKKDLPSHRNTLVKLVKFVDKIVNKQYMEIKRDFETSIRKVMNHHKNIPMLAGVLRKVSIFALNLMVIELKRKELSLKKHGSTCGYQFLTSCGLLCACRLEEIENKGQQISIKSIDVLWKKLNFKPANKSEDISRYELKSTFLTSAPFLLHHHHHLTPG